MLAIVKTKHTLNSFLKKLDLPHFLPSICVSISPSSTGDKRHFMPRSSLLKTIR
jgi:hypothetical protein